MSRFVSESELQGIRKLIEIATHIPPSDENFKRCEKYALSMLSNHHYLDPHPGDVEKAMKGIIEKLTIHAHFQRAAKLKTLVENLMSNEELSKDDRKVLWNILHFLISMSTAPASDKEIEVEPNVTESEPEEDKVDWLSYLMEDVEIDPAIGQESSDESEWSMSQPEAPQENELLPEMATEELQMDTNSDRDASSSTGGVASGQTDQWLEEINESWRAIEIGYRCPISSKFPASKLIDLWSKVVSLDGPKPLIRVLSEYMIVREVLMALNDPEACGLVFQRRPNHKYLVQHDLAVCSLTPKTLHESLSIFCTVLSTLSEMQSFINEMIPSVDKNDDKEPPATYKMYACALNKIRSKQKLFLCKLEKKVVKQDDIATVMSITSKLNGWIQFQMALFSVHKKAVDDWKNKDSWFCAVKLLSVLGRAVEESSSSQMISVFLSLLLESLKPYLDVLESWLKIGNLQDPYDEFIIHLGTGAADTLDNNYERRPFDSELRAYHVTPASFLECLASHGEVAGRSIQLLQGLRTMDSVPHPENQASLHCELVSLVRSRVLPCPTDSPVDWDLENEEPSNETPPAEPEPVAATSELDQYIQDYLVSTNDPYMLQAFSDILDFGLGVDQPQETFQYPEEHFLFKRGEVSTVQPLGPVLKNSLSVLLARRVEGLGLRARQLLHEKCRVGVHLAAMRGVALLEAGIAMHQFFCHVINRMTQQDDWRRWASWYLLTNQLQACLSQYHVLDTSHLFSIAVVDRIPISKTSEITEGFPLMQFLNHLELQYKLEWPISIVLRDTNMEIYNRVFRFLAKVKCALLSLQRLSWTELKYPSQGPGVGRRLAVLRAWLLFMLGSLQEHLLGHILTTLRSQLDLALAQAKDLHSALAAHNDFVKKAHTYCLMDPKLLSGHNMIMEVVALSMSVCDGWGRGDLTLMQVAAFESDYTKLHNFLSYLFVNLTRFGANIHFAGIAAALDLSSPPY